MSLSSILGWGGNLALIAGFLLIGVKWPHAFLLTVIGAALWLWESIRLKRSGMVCLCAVFTLIALWNWIQWAFLATP